jgi:hypothetical protein
LDVHAGRGRIAAETDIFGVQHIDVEGIRNGLVQQTFPEATN